MIMLLTPFFLFTQPNELIYDEIIECYVYAIILFLQNLLSLEFHIEIVNSPFL